MNNNLESKISRSFGIEDKKFARHPSDLEQAKELIRSCLSESIKLDDLLNKIDCWYRKEVGYIGQDEVVQDFQNKHIRNELKEVEKLYKKLSSLY
ncbi:hypothetical protein [Aliarcobacter butzleri]|uniref:hypothetical protein n=1 Tax=Aliarcobacter butzleri TaxID=28197 RepID=UPI00158729CB|nr:hypothetical protein [Aliarcobacter butzleri]NUW29571.1 hypothetical protein [Aliarcobacter butzleri]